LYPIFKPGFMKKILFLASMFLAVFAFGQKEVQFSAATHQFGKVKKEYLSVIFLPLRTYLPNL